MLWRLKHSLIFAGIAKTNRLKTNFSQEGKKERGGFGSVPTPSTDQQTRLDRQTCGSFSSRRALSSSRARKANQATPPPALWPPLRPWRCRRRATRTRRRAKTAAASRTSARTVSATTVYCLCRSLTSHGFPRSQHTLQLVAAPRYINLHHPTHTHLSTPQQPQQHPYAHHTTALYIQATATARSAATPQPQPHPGDSRNSCGAATTRTPAASRTPRTRRRTAKCRGSQTVPRSRART